MNGYGKTTLLTALYRTNPIIPADAAVDETYDYPKREVEDYRFAVENGGNHRVFVILPSYIKPLSEVDRFVGEHRELLER
jgi:hypothetical protein